MKKPPRHPTPEEQALWEQVAQTVKPIRKKTVLPAPEKTATAKSIPIRQVTKPSSKILPELAQGSYGGIDRKNAERFRKGKKDLDGTLDLHGMTREQAFGALLKFIRSHFSRESRNLLIITGKGKGDAPGVLRESLPLWLNNDELRPMILAFDAAQQKDGGSGAFYVMLKRNR